jgi:hypothetical protein
MNWRATAWALTIIGSVAGAAGLAWAARLRQQAADCRLAELFTEVQGGYFTDTCTTTTAGNVLAIIGGVLLVLGLVAMVGAYTTGERRQPAPTTTSSPDLPPGYDGW